MKVRDSSLGSVCLALEWLSFSDLLGRAVLQGQSFQLLRYLPFLPVAFHLLFAAASIPRLAYPSSQAEASPAGLGDSLVALQGRPLSVPVLSPRPWPG